MSKELIRLAMRDGIFVFFQSLKEVLREMAHEQKRSFLRDMGDEIWDLFFTKYFGKM